MDRNMLKNCAKFKILNLIKKTPNNGQTELETVKPDVKIESGTLQQTNAETKNILQKINELASFHKLKVTYDILSENGPQHAKIFEVKCSLVDLKTNTNLESFTTSGSSHTKAKQNAAEIAINQTKLEIPTKEQLSKKKNAPKERKEEKQKKNKSEKRLSN